MHPRDYWIYGSDDGSWEMPGHAILSYRSEGFDWYLAPAMSAQNGRRNFSAEGATETHAGFRRALAEAVADYPELQDWIISFDGPPVPITAVLAALPFSWSHWIFYHGTAEALLPTIRQQGICPRTVTGAGPSYGGEERAGRPDAVYLTTQLNMARFAARDAGRATRSRPVILAVHGIPETPHLLVPDEDSGEPDARLSLDRMGSFGFLGCVPPTALAVGYVLANNEWHAR